MKNYVISTKITATLTFLSCLIIFVLHYKFEDMDFWINFCLAIFGSGLLTFITSVVGYFVEKQNSLEAFAYSTRNLLNIINGYDIKWDVYKKIDFFLDYINVDKSLWDSQLGAIYFMNDFKRKKFKYVYNNIYKPILDLNRTIKYYEVQFRAFGDSSGESIEVMKLFITKIESAFMEVKTSEYVLENGEKCSSSGSTNNLVKIIWNELNGKYYTITYGKKFMGSEDI